MPMNNRILRPLARPLLLDAVPGAAAAYSLRQLSNSYAGPVVTVRRSSDDAEEDFKASEIDDGTLAAFCGAGDGLVKTWHDQSGNNRDASATGTAQPKVVDSGSLVTEGGKAAVQFDGVNDFLLASSVVESQPLSFFVSGKKESLSGKQNYFDGAVSAGRTESFLMPTTNYMAIQAGSILQSAVVGDTNAEILFAVFDGLSSAIYKNGALIASGDAGTKGVTTLVIGADNDQSDFLEGTISELIIYPSDQSANRERIEGDIAWYY